MTLSLSQKLLLGFGALAAFLFISSSASAATPGTTGGGGVPGGGGGGGGGGGNATVPNAGDRLLVVTTDPGLAGRLYIRSNPGTSQPQVGLAAHGETLTATGAVQTASDGTVWWQVRNAQGTTGWSESNYLQDTGQ